MVAKVGTYKQFDQQQTRESIETPPILDQPWNIAALDIFYCQKDGYLMTTDFYSDLFETRQRLLPNNEVSLYKMGFQFT